jgi:hypothetical protein
LLKRGFIAHSDSIADSAFHPTDRCRDAQMPERA